MDKRQHRLSTEYGLSYDQLSRLPAYVVDAMDYTERTLSETKRALAVSEGIKPKTWREAHRMEGAQVETLDGTYVFPFTPEERSRANVALCLPSGAKVQMIFRHSDPNEVEVYCEGQIALHPTAANTFRLTINGY